MQYYYAMLCYIIISRGAGHIYVKRRIPTGGLTRMPSIHIIYDEYRYGYNAFPASPSARPPIGWNFHVQYLRTYTYTLRNNGTPLGGARDIRHNTAPAANIIILYNICGGGGGAENNIAACIITGRDAIGRERARRAAGRRARDEKTRRAARPPRTHHPHAIPTTLHHTRARGAFIDARHRRAPAPSSPRPRSPLFFRRVIKIDNFSLAFTRSPLRDASHPPPPLHAVRLYVYARGVFLPSADQPPTGRHPLGVISHASVFYIYIYYIYDIPIHTILYVACTHDVCARARG